MKALVEDESGEALLWSLAYGVAYTLLLHKVPDIEYHGTRAPLVGPALQANHIDAAARCHADRIMQTLNEKSAALKQARAARAKQ